MDTMYTFGKLIVSSLRILMCTISLGQFLFNNRFHGNRIVIYESKHEHFMSHIYSSIWGNCTYNDSKESLNWVESSKQYNIQITSLTYSSLA